MNRGVDHQPVFFAPVDRFEFGRQLAWAHEQLDVSTLAYCLMDNHFHLLLRCRPGALSDAMQHALGVYTRRTNDRIGRDGPLFRGRFHSIPVETDAYLLQATRYIHRNPLSLPGIGSPRDHRWSSYRAYLGFRRCPPFLDVTPVTSLLGGVAGVAAFTEDDDEPPLGWSTPMRVEDVGQLIDLAIAVDDLHHRSDDGARRWLARTVALLLADRCPDLDLGRRLTVALGHPSPDAARSALRRARRRHDDDPVVRRVLDWVTAELVGEGLTHSDRSVRV